MASKQDSPSVGVENAQSQAQEPAHDQMQNSQMDMASNAKEEPLEYDDDGEPGDPDDKTGGAEGSIKRPRLRLSQACEYIVQERSAKGIH